MKKPMLPMKIVVFFARNPDEELTMKDIHAKFGVGYNLSQQLKHITEQGWIRKLSHGSKNNPSVYGAGPRLLE
jgi:hypothetical protein